jgi:hypothetical protein
MEDKDRIQEILERLVRMEVKLDDFKTTRQKAEDAYVMGTQNSKDIQEIKDNNKWLTRAIVGVFIANVVAVLLKLM